MNICQSCEWYAASIAEKVNASMKQEGCKTCGARCGGKPICADCFLKANYRGAPGQKEAMKQETIAVPVEVVRELKRQVAIIWPKHCGDTELTKRAQAIRAMVASIPEPPKPDVVEECARAYRDNPTTTSELGHPLRVRAALRRYRELGCPELDDK